MVVVRRLGVLFLLSTVLLKKCGATCPSLTSSVEEGRAVCPGEELTYTCSIFDDTSFLTTTWRMTPQPCVGGFVGLVHSTLGDPPIECGPFSANLTASDGDCYNSTLTVTASPELNGTVVSCEDTLGNVAGSATINIETGSLDVVVTPVYDSVKLERTEIAWNAICSPMTEYNSTVVCGAYVDTYLAECPGETCVSVVDVSNNANDDCTVSVSAAALSEQRTVNIDNDFLYVTVLDAVSPTVVNYTFKNEYPGKACFGIAFSYWDQDGMRMNTTETSFQCLGYEDSTEVLQEILPPKTNYTYVASTFECGACEPGQFQLTLSVVGSGTTGNYEFGSCDATHLVGGNINPSCSDDGTEGGCVTYTDPLSPGSVATYSCYGDYVLQGSAMLMCQRNGVWSGNPPACIPPEASIINIAVIILIVIAAILLVTTVIFFVLFIFCWKAQIHGKVSGGQRLGSPSEMKAL